MKTLKANIDVEQLALSNLLVHHECRQDIGRLSIEDFTSREHQSIFRAIKDMLDSGEQFDNGIMISKIDPIIRHIAVDYSINELALKMNQGAYIRELKDCSLRRKLNNLAESMILSDKSGQELSELAEREIFRLRETIQTNDFVQAKDIIAQVLDDIEKQHNTSDHTGVKTGFHGLDKITDGLQPGEYILIGGRPSMGKTAFALNIASNVSQNGLSVALFSLEMNTRTVMKRIVLADSKVSDEKLKQKQLEDTDFHKLLKSSNDITRKKISICDRANITVPELKSMCRKLKRSEGLDLVIIDYLQLLNATNGSNRREQVEDVSRSLKAAAKELNVPVIVVSSLSRAGSERANKRPILSDLRETGQIEYDCDVIMFLHREYYYNPEDADPESAELIISKHRNGALGKINLRWFSEHTLFTNKTS